MKPLFAVLVAAAVLAAGLVGGTTAVAAGSDGSPQASADAVTAKKKAGKKVPKKQGSKNTGPYREGQVCSLGAEKQREYAKYGLICLDISAYQDGSLTTLVKA